MQIGPCRRPSVMQSDPNQKPPRPSPASAKCKARDHDYCDRTGHDVDPQWYRNRIKRAAALDVLRLFLLCELSSRDRVVLQLADTGS